MDTDCVTGLQSDPERQTPCGIFKIWSHESPRKLGTYAVQGYETWVDYWMPVTYTGIGLHDLDRSAYGGNIYLTNGSHGCINLPHDFAASLFDSTVNGIPVIIHE
jgi:lipoprotein-anchoring transpeptidase ErfK/SrfK